MSPGLYLSADESWGSGHTRKLDLDRTGTDDTSWRSVQRDPHRRKAHWRLQLAQPAVRRGMNSLALQVQEALRRDPHDFYVFRGKSGKLIKILWHDGLGVSLYAKRLEHGRFVWPSTAPREGADRTVTITSAQLGYLLEGIDWRLPERTWRPQVAG